jgi:hypothetical protein
VWLDLIASPDEWAASFLSDEAGEVLAVLGGIVLVFALPAASSDAAAKTRDLIRQVGRVVKDGLGGWAWDGVGLAVGVGEGNADEWDDLSADAGLEFVQVQHNGGKDQGRNEFGGMFAIRVYREITTTDFKLPEKTGIPRVKEALESNDWAQLDSGEALSDFGDFKEGEDETDDKDLDPESLDFGFDRADFEGMRKAIWSLVGEAEEPQTTNDSSASKNDTDGEHKESGADGEVSEDQVAKVEMMMRKLQATREAGEGMSQDQRRRMAARAVEEVMREL